ncbi:MAG: peptide-methionine (S)-S-oxide reductase MsrA [Candidatus Marinimicrobia bacterium]|nr:peptide-methionine (S)-S-oxide reductase MsrA [Candidatus Neomarinimicrobiota bacterium]
MSHKSEKVIFGGGCFWCLEAVFNRVGGVIKVESGYAGGETENPTYQEVCAGETGHAEVIQIEFQPGKITYKELLEIFWQAHDPTTLNRQGADVGTQYRSIIITHNEDQKIMADSSKILWDKYDLYKDSIITEIVTQKKFYPAEKYHQDYYQNNKLAGYCRLVISPKIKKLLAKGIIKEKPGD